ncbi:MAG: 3-hydroxyacyl-CoA dehydrogenase NAD-binding domain-containing protein [Nitrososphaeria archaeon]|nr:3-hydroxyacyl-CoA dehydrogenase NAD-binding domain-containing protein [Conexivisphaerales archaeon]
MKVAVIGAGTMGHGIAQVSAMAGYDVWMYDLSQEILNSAMSRIRDSLNKFYAKGVVKDVEQVISRIRPTASLEEALSGSELMVEASPEILEVKVDIFRKAERLSERGSVLATNTSSLPITEIADSINEKGRVIGLHFFNPPQLMKLVEVIKSVYTTDETLNMSLDFVNRLSKKAVIVKKDVPGFVVNRLLARLMNASCQLLEKNYASMIEIDSAVKYKLGFPMGVFELADYSGVDVFYLVFKAMKDRGFRGDVCPTFEKMFSEKKFGVKTGEGFYSYPGKGVYKKPEIPKEAGTGFDPWLVAAPEVGEAFWLMKTDTASESDIDTASMLGLGYPKGIVQMGREFGLENVKDRIKKMAEITGKEEYSYLLQFLE